MTGLTSDILRQMDGNFIYHAPRHLDLTVTRRIEVGREILSCPEDQPEIVAECPNCGCVMMYRGMGRSRGGRLVHVFECVHSHREVHSVSIVVSD